jgi:hypothetical protein
VLDANGDPAQWADAKACFVWSAESCAPDVYDAHWLTLAEPVTLALGKPAHAFIRLGLGRTGTQAHRKDTFSRSRNQPLGLSCPSPDGRHLAFSQNTVERNAWLLESF